MQTSKLLWSLGSRALHYKPVFYFRTSNSYFARKDFYSKLPPLQFIDKKICNA